MPDKKNQQVEAKSRFEQMLFENFVSLQKTLANLAVKLDKLTNETSRLLQLFEVSARTFTEKHLAEESIEKEKQFLEKIDRLLDQNKVIAKGLVLMGEKVKHNIPASVPAPSGSAVPLPPAGFAPSAMPAMQETPPALKSQPLPKLKNL